ncbi:hypothetical protein P170DRAFT_425743 [Aspergillus steynii IBT 23096]|uniref:Uncharacterized protein n=1 Tax=Aspergillus steynii IBT 23096 TaxID=1392250 RepID=A0A2I2G758_9EURO|nr:uncharacterized protein P170DRAFT_425743 [Aspergillus steynii IBT 23096]PLB48716.1 hypothetical protein P170DRAFT_425743 [Aspergillus steynii IBT 23096]
MSSVSENESQTDQAPAHLTAPLTIEEFSEADYESEPDQSPTHLTPEQLELWFELTDWIINAQGPTYHEKLGIPPEVGFEVAKTLCDKGDVEARNPTVEYNPIVHRLSIRMCSNARAGLSSWVINGQFDAVRSGFFTMDELRDTMLMLNAGIYRFSAPYEKAYKDGGGYFPSNNFRFPCIAFESGHEPWANLLEVKDIWLQGGAPYVNAVLVVQWDERDNGEVAGSLELHRRNGIVGSRIQVFPVPEPGTPHAAQFVTFYRRDFYPEGKVPDGRNPDDVWNWELDEFRRYATMTMGITNLRPAEA